MEALFVSEQYIKDNTIIDGNVDVKYITNTIADVQRLYILPLLGTALYNELQTQVNAGTLTALNTTLIDSYIADVIRFYVLVEGLDIFHYKVTNKAIMTKNSDNSQPIQQLDVIRLIDKNRNNAEFFAQRLTNYIIANQTSYPLYYAPGSTFDTVIPKRNSYSIGWNLDDTHKTYGLPISPSKFQCDE